MYANGRNSYKVQYMKEQHRRPLLTAVRAKCCNEIAYNRALAAMEWPIQLRTILINRTAQFFQNIQNPKSGQVFRNRGSTFQSNAISIYFD